MLATTPLAAQSKAEQAAQSKAEQAAQQKNEATAPSKAELVALGDRESAARHPAAALTFFERAIKLDSTDYEAQWKASRELVDLGEAERSADVQRRFFDRATEYAKRAVRINPKDAEGHFHLARAIGRTALSVSSRDRVKYALDVRAEALRALELSPRHPGALHVMGVWNAEVMRLNGVARFVAKNFMGGKVLDSANWEEATRLMELSVSVDPTRLIHRLDLARIYRDTGRKNDARAAYQAALAASFIDANDELYRKDAEREMAALNK